MQVLQLASPDHQQQLEPTKESLQCAVHMLDLLNDLCYYESPEQVTWLKELELVRVLANCHPALQSRKEFAQLVTNITMLNKPELKQVSLGLFMGIIENDMLFGIMFENFLKSEQAQLKEEGVVFLTKFLAHLQRLLE